MKKTALILSLLGVALLSGAPLAVSGGGVAVAFTENDVPVSPDDAAWDKIPATEIALMPQMIVTPRGGAQSVKNVTVQAVHDGLWLAMRLTWSDATPDQSVGVDAFRDAIAIGFPITETETPPSPFMGDAEHPVNIWQWTADFDANSRGEGGFAERYPHTEGVWYFPADPAVTRTVTGWRGFEAVAELEAYGFGTLERKSVQNVRGLGLHSDGEWSVVLRRRMSTGQPRDPQFRATDETMAIFAVWNGDEGDVNGMKAITMAWTPISFAPTTGGE